MDYNMDYQPMPEPGSPEFEKRFSEAYERYANTPSPTVYNERTIPEGQNVFAWLLEDKELIKETDEALREAGFGW